MDDNTYGDEDDYCPDCGEDWDFCECDEGEETPWSSMEVPVVR